jgi:phosphate acetyltransferase
MVQQTHYMVSEHPFLVSLKSRAAQQVRRIAFPDATDVRTLEAAGTLVRERLATPLLIGSAQEIEALAVQHEYELEGIEILEPASSIYTDELANRLYERRKTKGLSIEQARQHIMNPLYFAGMAVSAGIADASVGGSLSATSDVLRAALHTIGTAEGITSISSFFLMIAPAVQPDAVLAFADCAVIPEPSATQLVDIALATAENYKALTHETPRVALLSFSTNGSGGDNPSLLHVRDAAQTLRERYPELACDGELQFDAAFVASVAARKAPQSPVAGKANVFIFPNLNAGNIGYKIAERLGQAQAVGPVVQGLRKPYLDLSRGCTASDIVLCAAIASLMAAV